MALRKKFPSQQRKAQTRAVYIYFSLALIAILQMGWWAYLVVSQQKTIHILSGTLESQQKLEHYQFMILTESVFAMLIWIVGLWLAYRAFNQQIRLLKAQTNFVSAVSHELKTPIASIQLCLDTLKRKDIDQGKQQVYLDRAQQSIHSLEEEVDKILLLGVEDPILSLVEKNSLTSLIEEIKVLLQKKHQKELNLQIISEEKNIFIRAPKHESKFILSAIFDNAIKYSLAKNNKLETINIYLAFRSLNERRGELQITDHGIGIKKGENKFAFDRFWRSDLAVEKAIPGTGLGLSLAKKVATQYAIDLSICTNETSSGVTIRTEWPLEQ